MIQQSFNLPAMDTCSKAESAAYALRSLPGVVDVLASATLHQIVVHYDESRISPATIVQHLQGLGFAPYQDDQAILTTGRTMPIVAG
jgi:cation transport ATPase